MSDQINFKKWKQEKYALEKAHEDDMWDSGHNIGLDNGLSFALEYSELVNETIENQLAAEKEKVRELQWFADRMTKYVLPGSVDSQDSALTAFKNLEEKVRKLREALEYIIANRYGAQGYVEENDIEGLASYWAQEAISYQNIARKALKETEG